MKQCSIITCMQYTSHHTCFMSKISYKSVKSNISYANSWFIIATNDNHSTQHIVNVGRRALKFNKEIKITSTINKQ